MVARITPIAKRQLGYSQSGKVHERTFVLRANANGVFDQLPPQCSTLQLPDIFLGRKKLVAPNLIGYSQCEDRVTNTEGKKTATGYMSDSFA